MKNAVCISSYSIRKMFLLKNLLPNFIRRECENIGKRAPSDAMSDTELTVVFLTIRNIEQILRP